MGTRTCNCVAIDCGNSSIRVSLGRFDGRAFATTVIDQAEHHEILVNGVWHWDILFLFSRIKQSLKKAHALCGRIDSAGISTWGIDHGLFDAGGLLLANPFCYRNPFGQEALARLDERERRFLFDATGIQCDKINTIFHMLGYRDKFPAYWGAAKSALLIPDLLNFLLTGERNSDASITSTTQLYDVVGERYATAVFDRFRLDPALFPEVLPHGVERGVLRRDIADELGINAFPVVNVPSHDTAAAVAALPRIDDGRRPLFISSGTWCLIGVELPRPLVNDAVYRAGLANEAGALGTTTLLKNSAGLFIAQRLKRECESAGSARSWDDITAAIDRSRPACGLIDPNDESFFNPPAMREAIAGYLRKRGHRAPEDEAGYFRVVYESLAHSYKLVIDDIERAVGEPLPVLNIIGGGARNGLLNRFAAEATGRRVVAGPAEATSLGIMAMQLFREGSVKTLADVRRVAAASSHTAEYAPG